MAKQDKTIGNLLRLDCVVCETHKQTLKRLRERGFQLTLAGARAILRHTDVLHVFQYRDCAEVLAVDKTIVARFARL